MYNSPSILTKLVRYLEARETRKQHRRAIRLAITRQPVRIVVGSGGIHYEGWLSTDQDDLDLLKFRDWSGLFGPNSIDAILAEHVWEHLAKEGALIAARNCFRLLKPGGYIRVAVPDGNHPDPDYIDLVRPGGAGSGSDDHKVLYTFTDLKKIFVSVGFEVDLLEYFDETGDFRFSDWDPEAGMIRRSRRFDPRNVDGELGYTSIILDARKPGAVR